jgi:hypothetical protein
MFRSTAISANRRMTAPSDNPTDQGSKTARDSGGRADCSAQLGADTHRDPDHVRARHQLAKGQRLGELMLIHPPFLLDNDAAHPDEPATEATRQGRA